MLLLSSLQALQWQPSVHSQLGYQQYLASCHDHSGPDQLVQFADPLPTCEDNTSLADIVLGELVIDKPLADAPVTVDAEFAELDNGASVAFAKPLAINFEESVRAFCLVYKSVSFKSRAAQTPQAPEAIVKEIKNMESLNVWDPYETAVEVWQLQALQPDILIVYGHLLLGCKNLEGLADIHPNDPDNSSLLEWPGWLQVVITCWTSTAKITEKRIFRGHRQAWRQSAWYAGGHV